MVLTEKVAKMPRTNATYEEYEKFLTSIYEICRSNDHAVSILNRLAERKGVEKPENVFWSWTTKPEGLIFSADKPLHENLLSFYTYFRVTKWNRDDEADVEELEALLLQAAKHAL